VRATLGARDGMNLVEDHGLDAAKHLPCLRGEQQEERLGGRDQDVRRRSQHPATFVGGGVPGPNPHGQLRVDPYERVAQIALDVVVERLKRRDAEKAEPGARGLVQPIDPDEESGKGLPGPRWRLDEDMPTRRDRRPAELLCRRRRRERPLEPRPRRLREDVEWPHVARVSGCRLGVRLAKTFQLRVTR